MAISVLIEISCSAELSMKKVLEPRVLDTIPQHSCCITMHLLNKLFYFCRCMGAYAKTNAQISFAVTAKLISAFVFATQIVQFLYFLNEKFRTSNSIFCDCTARFVSDQFETQIVVFLMHRLIYLFIYFRTERTTY